MSDKIKKQFENAIKIFLDERKYAKETNDGNLMPNSKAKDAFEKLTDSLTTQSDLIKKCSIAMGKYADVPWISFHIDDKRIFESTSFGVYIVYLFSNDGNEVYLTLGQGYEKLSKIVGEERLPYYSNIMRTLIDADDFPNDEIDLKSENKRAKGYTKTTFCAKKYDLNNMPDDEIILRDLNYYCDLYYELYHFLKVDGLDNFYERHISVAENVKNDKKKKITRKDLVLSDSLRFNEQDAVKIDEIINKLKCEGEEKIILTKARINHSKFKEALLWKNRECALCGLNNASLLIASHIKPWSKSNSKEKTDVNNGLLLCPNHDKVFDNGLISFDEDENILLSSKLNEKDKMLLNLTGNEKIEITYFNMDYIRYHRENIFIK